MNSRLLLLCAAVMCLAPNGMPADFPSVHPLLRSGRITIRKALILPAEVEYKKVGFKGVTGGAAASDQLAVSLTAVTEKELIARGVAVLPARFAAAQDDSARHAVTDLQARYDTVAVQMRSNPDSVEHGRITLDDRVALFEPGAEADVLVFVRGDGNPHFMSGRTFRADLAFVDAKTGDVLAFARFELLRNVTKKTDERLLHAVHEALEYVPLPVRVVRK